MAFRLEHHGSFMLLTPSKFGRKFMPHLRGDFWTIRFLMLRHGRCVRLPTFEFAMVHLKVPGVACRMQYERICVEPALHLKQHSGLLSRLT